MNLHASARDLFRIHALRLIHPQPHRHARRFRPPKPRRTAGCVQAFYKMARAGIEPATPRVSGIRPFITKALQIADFDDVSRALDSCG
jgi:hypothetical protein